MLNEQRCKRVRFHWAMRCAIVLGMSLVSVSCEPDFNWCTEAQREDFTRAGGRVAIRYEGSRTSSGTVEITPYVKLLEGGVLVQGCGKRDGDLWRWRSGFGNLKPGVLDAPISGADEDVDYTGEVWFCPNDDCSDRNRVVTVSRAEQESWPATGVMHEYEPSQGTLRASIRTTSQRGDTTDIEVDVRWDTADASGPRN